MSGKGSSKTLHIILVLLVFTCTGLTAAYLGRVIMSKLAIERFSWQYWFLWIVCILPIYNIIILFYAAIFGKFNFFREKQKRLWRRLTRKDKRS